MSVGLHEFCTARVQELDEALGAYFTKRMRDAASAVDLMIHTTTEVLPLSIKTHAHWLPELSGIPFLTAELAAKRRILYRHRPLSQVAPEKVYFDGSNAEACHGCGDAEFDIYRVEVDGCLELADLAAPYSAHPDYEDRWKP